MSFPRHKKIYRSDLKTQELKTWSSSQGDHRFDESSTSYLQRVTLQQSPPLLGWLIAISPSFLLLPINQQPMTQNPKMRQRES